MFDEEERVWNAPRAAIVDKRSLQRQGVSVRNKAEPPHVERSRLSHPPFLPFLPFLPIPPVPPVPPVLPR